LQSALPPGFDCGTGGDRAHTGRAAAEDAAAKNPLPQRGYSRDHHADCRQELIALIINAGGFPLSCETFDGNRADATPVEARTLPTAEFA